MYGQVCHLVSIPDSIITYISTFLPKFLDIGHAHLVRLELCGEDIQNGDLVENLSLDLRRSAIRLAMCNDAKFISSTTLLADFIAEV